MDRRQLATLARAVATLARAVATLARAVATLAQSVGIPPSGDGSYHVRRTA
ncbi:MAG: hypothetical protein ACYC0X_00965 [Pirellulaceae bacterium]